MKAMTIPLYDQFSSDYDRFVNWERRLEGELPFIEAQLAKVGARRVLDAACGTGRHAIALANLGYTVTGADPSTGMIERARQSAASTAMSGSKPNFEVAAFGELASAGMNAFDAVLCLGSSLPHLLNKQDLAAALADFAAVLQPGGLLLIQNRNFDMVLAQRQRWIKPQSRREGDQEWLFLRVYDFNDDGTITFNVITLRRQGQAAWQQQVEVTRLTPWRQAELLAALDEGGWADVTCRGNMSGDEEPRYGSPFDPNRSPNLVITARRI